jgi:hypothetical protein
MREMCVAGRVGRLVGVVWLGLWLAGCVPAAVFTGEYLEAKREASRDYPASLDRVWPAALQALRESRAQIRNSIRDNIGGDIDGTWPGEGPLAVRMEQTGPNATRVKVSIGDRGNREVAESVLTRIAVALQTIP